MLRLLSVVGMALLGAAGSAQEPSPSPPIPASPTAPPTPAAGTIVASRITDVAPAAEAFTMRYGNRRIVVLRGRVLGRGPAERALAAVHRLDALVADGLVGPVDRRFVEGLVVLTVANHDAVTILPTDVDELRGETIDTKSREAAAQLRLALQEVAEAHSPERLFSAALMALAATALALALLGLLVWGRRRVAALFGRQVEARLGERLGRLPGGDVWRTAESGALSLLRGVGRVSFVALYLLLGYAWLTFVLRRFPYTRPWGEALRGFVLGTVLVLGKGMLAAVPGLFTVAVIVVITRLLARGVHAFFLAVERGRVALPGVYPDTAQPTRRLMVALLWIFAVVVAYPYLPGSGTDAFKGVSVLVGLMVSLGSTGFVNQVMSSFMITYSRSLRVGEYVRIGDVEGSIVQAGLLSTKVRTPRNEEVTLPNAVVAASTITNFSRFEREGVYARTAVTIGYDTPWRQVEAMLLEAGRRTRTVRQEPPPRVLQTALQDFYVEYTLLVALEHPETRILSLHELHRNVQDVFNEHGVQIMSPHYRADPDTAKVVPKAKWYAPPATRADGPPSRTDIDQG
jgi:small-conductance mechanosensitive channel